MNINAVNANAVSWETLLSSLGEVEKAGNVEGKQNFTITTNVDGTQKTVSVSVPEDLEIPANVDQSTLEGLVDKLKATGLGFTDEQIAQMKDSIAKIYDDSTVAAKSFASKSTGKVLFDLYALMSLMIEVAQSQRDAAREMRTAENLSVQKAIQNQADEQRAAAMVGMIVGITCGLASAAVSIGTMVGQGIAAKAQNQIMAQSGADAAKMHSEMLQNTDNVATAQAKLDQVAAKVGDDVANSVTNDFNSQLVDDQAGNLRTNLDNANGRVNTAQQSLEGKTAELQTAQNTLAEKQETLRQVESARLDKQTYIRDEMNAGRQPDQARLQEFDARAASLDQARADVNTAQNEVQVRQGAVDLANTELTNAKAAHAQAKADYVKTVQDVAAQYQEKYQTAVERNNNPPAGADKAQLKAAVDTARAKMEMAYAKEAQLLSQDGVMTPSEQKDLVAAARARVDVTMERMTQRVDFKAAERKMSTLMGINNINQAIGGVLQSTASNLSGLRSAEAVRTGAESKKQEEMLDQTKDLFAQEQKLIDQVIQLFSAVIQAENQSMRDAIQA